MKLCEDCQRQVDEEEVVLLRRQLEEAAVESKKLTSVLILNGLSAGAFTAEESFLVMERYDPDLGVESPAALFKPPAFTAWLKENV
jgi:hypothetical protein